MALAMLDEVRRYILRGSLLPPGAPVRVAVSGGVDSMVLLHVLRALGHPCKVAHADHGLRGTESDGDREFVVAHCRALGVAVETARLDVKAHASANGLSVQMAARELRLSWLKSLGQHDGLPTALGHHADDAVETLFINLLRGTGEHGWCAMAPVSGSFIRPLLGVHRTPILEYAQEEGIPFREDSSNAEAKYLRNRIRHELVPLLDNLRPGATRTIARSIAMLRELEHVAEDLGLERSAGVEEAPDGTTRARLEAIEGSHAPLLLLHRLLRPRGFHPDAIERVLEAVRAHATGSLFATQRWQACVDRKHLIISPAAEPAPSYSIEQESGHGIAGPFSFGWMDQRGGVPASMDEVLLDADRLSFPMELRPWRHGDRIRPIGLHGTKLVSDILIDAKVPRSEKPSTYVLVSAGEVAWLVGHRLAEGFQASDRSRRVWHCRLHKN
ncbi:MAG: tRNA lysidine(34) synthetase TilS [Flavobacteriales bacterium]|nr:tRNA lysidine(34) synthetase TilS [Flavobacteriales bacterium]